MGDIIRKKKLKVRIFYFFLLCPTDPRKCNLPVISALPSIWSHKTSGMTFIYEHKGIVSLCKVTDLTKRGNVPIHREHTICNYETQPVFLERNDRLIGWAYKSELNPKYTHSVIDNCTL